jgi:hypothetical protein
MLGIKDKFPQFNGKAVVTNDVHNAFGLESAKK